MAVSGPGPWTQPLDRIVSFRVADLSLREALDRLAATHKLKLSYSSESLELDRTVCVALDSVALGTVFAELLRGTGVEPVPAGGNHVVLAPVTYEFAQAPAPEPSPPVVLDRILVTGSPAGGGERRPLPVAIDILEGGALYGHTNGTLTAVFNGGVPGMWLWEQAPTSLLARYGSIRGASSFGLSYPKVYVDGIQVANPLLLTRITPEAIDHIEVIRGPQGAALYGADAISGVANVVLRQDNADGGSPKASLRSGFGFANSDFAGSPTLDQSHVLSLRTGSNIHSATLNVEGGGIGAYIPGAFQRLFAATGAARVVSSQAIATGTVRLFTEQAGTPSSPLLAPTHLAAPGASDNQSVTQYTVGTNVKIVTGDHFTHGMVVGVDGYSLSGVPDDRSPIPSAANAALQAAAGGASRATVQVSTVAKLARRESFSSDLTILGEQSLLYQWSENTGATAATAVPGSGADLFTWRDNTGLSAQLGAGVLQHLFVTGGLRLERSSQGSRSAVLPMIGGAWVIDRGLVTVKLRGAYGKGIRWPETEARETMWRRQSTAPVLAPEEQSGIEGGMDIFVGRSLSFQVTRYDQVATGLIQRVLISADTVSGGGTGPRRIAYQSQNVGEVSNRGWELQGTVRRGRLSLAGTVSLTTSVVRRLAAGYTGDLMTGDRMLDVPSRTSSVTAGWLGDQWSASVTAYRAADWVSYDRLSLVQGLGGSMRPSRDFVGTMLRNYWLTYPGVTHLGLTMTRRLWGDVGVTVTGSNLLDRQRGEPDNITVLPGRTLSFGVRAGF